MKSYRGHLNSTKCILHTNSNRICTNTSVFCYKITVLTLAGEYSQTKTYVTVSPAKSYCFVTFTVLVAGFGNLQPLALKSQAVLGHALYTNKTCSSQQP